jgi:acyl-CoA synthetase (AMP-forming)/AMP-acid ligase II
MINGQPEIPGIRGKEPPLGYSEDPSLSSIPCDHLQEVHDHPHGCSKPRPRTLHPEHGTETPPRPITKGVDPAAIEARLNVLSLWPETLNAVADPESLAAHALYRRNIENFIGTVKIPVGAAGPLRLKGTFAQGDYYIPLATTEAALVASYNRGTRVVTAAGGCTAMMVAAGVNRAPGFAFTGVAEAVQFVGIERASARAAAMLSQAGLRAGDGVLIFQLMSSELYIALLAIFRLRLVALFIDPWAGKGHLETCCRLLPPKAFIAEPKAHLLRLLSPALRQIPVKFSTGSWVPGAERWDRWTEVGVRSAIASGDADTPALVTFTSGSTGEPKAAVRSHGFLLAQHRVLGRELGLATADISLSGLPIFVLCHLGAGVTSVIPDADLRRPGSIAPAPVVAQIRRHQVTVIETSPAFLERIGRYCGEHGISLGHVRKIFTGGAPGFPRLLDELQDVAPEAEVVTIYGATEAEPMVQVARRAMSREDRDAMVSGRGLLAGSPVPGLRLRILPDRWGAPVHFPTARGFDAACLAPGGIGEIVVSGEHVLPGYLNGRGDWETKFTVGDGIWHRTGDAGYLDGYGRLWLVGRCMARIVDGRGVLYPLLVESAASADRAVRRAACVSSDGRRILFVELEPHATRHDVSGLHGKLSWALLDEIGVLRRIPVDRRHNAKIDYPALRRMVSSPIPRARALRRNSARRLL